MIKVHFEGESWDVVREQIQAFAVSHLHAKFGELQISNGAVVEQSVSRVGGHSDMALPEEEPKKRGRKPKVQAAQDSASEVEAPKPELKPAYEQVTGPGPQMTAPQITAPQVATPSPAHTIEECTAALQKVWDKHGMERSLECLQRYGAKRARELDPKIYGQFIATCEENAK